MERTIYIREAMAPQGPLVAECLPDPWTTRWTGGRLPLISTKEGPSDSRGVIND